MRDAMQRHAQELAAANARFDRLLASQPVQQPQQQRSAAPQTPDPVLDPDGYGQYLRAQNEQFYAIKRTEETFAEQHETLGKEFEAAYIELQKLNPENPADRAIGNRIYTSPNPGKALMRWHREQAALREMGGDPAAYRTRLRDELINDPDVVKAVLARVREQGDSGRPGAPRNVTRLPPSLNRARGGASGKEVLTAADNTDEAVFDYAMNGRLRMTRGRWSKPQRPPPLVHKTTSYSSFAGRLPANTSARPSTAPTWARPSTRSSVRSPSSSAAASRSTSR